MAERNGAAVDVEPLWIAANRLHRRQPCENAKIIQSNWLLVKRKIIQDLYQSARVLVAPSWRGKGLGRGLIQESFAQALEFGLEKLCVQMIIDQRPASAVYAG